MESNGLRGNSLRLDRLSSLVLTRGGLAAMAWAEFSDWLRRTVERNVDDGPFEFDTRQWFGSIRKWWSRIVEMDVQAKAVS